MDGIDEEETLEQIIVSEMLDAPVPPLGERPLDWFVFSKTKGAMLKTDKLDECTCFVKGEKKACFADMAVGVLSQEQLPVCERVVEEAMTQEVERILYRAVGCSGELDEWLPCMRGSGLLGE